MKPLSNSTGVTEARPTREVATRDKFESIPGEQLDKSLKGQRVLLNRTRQAGGVASLFRRGLISQREHLAAIELWELYEIARGLEVIGRPSTRRIDDVGNWRTVDERLLAAADANDVYRTALDNLPRAKQVLVENVIVRGMPIEQVV